MSKDNYNTKKTAGEELWLIHLKRYQPDPEDMDVPKRKMSKSIGQELYEVHLKRCKGLSLECDSCKVDEDGTCKVTDCDDSPQHEHLDEGFFDVDSRSDGQRSKEH